VVDVRDDRHGPNVEFEVHKGPELLGREIHHLARCHDLQEIDNSSLAVTPRLAADCRDAEARTFCGGNPGMGRSLNKKGLAESTAVCVHVVTVA